MVVVVVVVMVVTVVMRGGGMAVPRGQALVRRMLLRLLLPRVAGSDFSLWLWRGSWERYLPIVGTLILEAIRRLLLRAASMIVVTVEIIHMTA